MRSHITKKHFQRTKNGILVLLTLIAIFSLQLGLWSAVGEAVNSTFYSEPGSVNLQALNNPPIITQGDTADIACEEDGATATLTLTATDDDGDTLTWSVSPAQRGIAEITAGVVHYTPAADENGTDQFTVTVDDGMGGSDTLIVHVTIAAVNDLPTFTAGANQTVQEDCGAVATPWALHISAGAPNEADQPLAFVVTDNANPTLFTADGQPAVSADGTLRYTPADNKHGVATIALRLKEQTEGGLSSAEKSFTITVSSVNDAPVCQTQPVVSGTAIVGQTLTVDNGVWADPTDQPAGTFTYAICWQSAADASGANLVTVGEGASFTVTAGQRHAFIRAQVRVTDTDDSGTVTVDTATPWMQVANQNPVLDQSTGTFTLQEDDAATSVTLAANDADGDTLHWSASSAALGAVSVQDGVVAYTPNADANGEDAFTVTVADDYGGEASCSFSVLIEAVNDPPSFTLGEDPLVAEDCAAQALTGWIPALNRGAANENDQTLRFTITNNTNTALFTAAGQPTVNAEGTLAFEPAPNQHGEAAITLFLQDSGDGANASAAQTFTITVTAVNDAPVNTETPAVTGTMLVGQTLTGAPGNWTDDADGNLQTPAFTYRWQSSEDAQGTGLSNLSEGAAYLITPQDAHRYLRVLVTAADTDDSGIATATATSDWQLVLNAAPVLTDASASIGLPEDSMQTFTLQATDADGDALSWTASEALHGTAMAADGDVTYQPEPNYHGEDSFIVTVTDGYGGAAEIPVAVTVTPVNDTPAFTLGDNVTVAEDAPAQSIPQWIAASSAGPEDEADQTWAFAVACDRSDLFATDGEPKLTPAGTLTFTPAKDANGVATVSVVMQDSGDGANTSQAQSFTLTVSPVNDPPTFTAGANQTVAEDSAPVTVPGWVQAFSAGPADEAEQTITYLATCDHTGLFTEDGQPAVTAEGTLAYHPAADAFGTATVTVSARDSGSTANAGDENTSASQTFTITVTPVNDAPSFTVGGNPTIAEDAGPQTLAGWATAIAAGPANESDQTLSFAVTGNTNTALFAGDGAPAVLPDGTLTYTTAANAYGSAVIALVVSDNGGVTHAGDADTSAAQTFTITVTPVNDAPWIDGADTFTTEEDTACEYTFTVGDMEDAASALVLAYDTTNTAMLKKSNMTLSGTGTNRTLTVMPEANRNGAVAVTLTATDRNNVSTTKTITLYITAVNDAPTISPIANRITDEDTSTGAIGLTIGDIDSDVSLCTVSAVSNNPDLVPNDETSIIPGGDGAARTLMLMPAKDQTGTAEITVTVSDGLKTAQTAFTLTVNPVNDAPTLTPIANQTINEDTDTGIIAFTVSDLDNPTDELTVSASTTNTAMIPRANIVLSPIGEDGGCTLTVTPVANSYGTATMTVSVKDPAGKLGTATFVLNVDAVNDVPVISAMNPIATPEDTAKAVTVTVGDIDTGAALLSLTATDTTNPDLLPLNRITVTSPTDTSRNVVFNPLPNRYGTATITLTLSDGQGGEATSTVAVTVQSVNDAPAFTAGENLTVVEDCGDVTSEAWAKAITTGADNEAQTLAFTVTTDHDSMFTQAPGINAETGTLTFTPAPDACGVVNVTAVLADSDGAKSAAAAFTITITAVNDAPVALDMDADINTDEDQNLSGSLRALDVDGDALTYELASGDDHGVTVLDTAHGTVTLNQTSGTFAYQPDIDFFDGADSFDFRVYDAKLYSNNATVTIAFTGVNDAPVAMDATITVAEDATDAVVDLSALVTDVDSPALTYTLVSGPDVGGMLTPTGDAGHYNYLPVANYNGVERFTYCASDGALVSNTAIVTLNMTPVNDAPVAVDEAVGVDEGQTLYGVLKATDVEGDAITYAILENPAPELLTLEDAATGLFRYNAPLATGSESHTLLLSYRATDANGATDDGIITIVVRSVNLPPARKAGATTQFTLMEDATLTDKLGVEDPNGDTLSYTVLNNPLHGAISGLDAQGNFTYTPSPNYHGGDRFTFFAEDPYGLHSGIYAVSLQITDVNDPPEAYDQQYETAYNTACGGIILVGYDPDGDSLTYEITQPANGTLIKETDGTYTYQPEVDYAGVDSFTYTANDGRGGISAPATVTLYVYGPGGEEIGLNYLPNRQTPEDTPIDVTVTANGFTIDTVTATSSNQWLLAAGGVGVNGATLTLTPWENRNGRTVITVHAVSGTKTYTRTFILTVTPVNDAPIPQTLVRTMDEDTEMFEFVSASDSDNDALVFAVATQPGNGTLSFTADGAFHYVPDNGYTGEDAFTYTVSDGQITADPQMVSITVVPIPKAPTAENASFATNEDTPLTQTLTGIDLNGETVQFILMQNPRRGTVALLADGSFTYTPYTNRYGSDLFTFCTKNEDGLYSAIAKVTLTVHPVNDLPNLVEKTLAAYEDTPVTGYLRATDADWDHLTYAIDQQEGDLQLGTLTLDSSTGYYRYLPETDLNGTDTFHIVVSDPTGSAPPVAFTVSIAPVNDPPAAKDVLIAATEDTAISGSVTGFYSDPDGDTQTLSLVQSPEKGTFSFTTEGQYTYTPYANRNGVDYFTFRTRDPGGLSSNVALATVEIAPVNDAPEIVAKPTMSIPEDSQNQIFEFTVGDVEDDASALTVSGAWDETKIASVTFWGTGASRWMKVTPVGNFIGETPIVVTVRDTGRDGTLMGEPKTAAATVAVTVTEVNDTPTVNGSATNNLPLTNAVTIDEDTSTNAIGYTVADEEQSAASLSVRVVSSNTALLPVTGIQLGGTDADRWLKATPAPNGYGKVRITVYVSDENTERSAYLDVTVNPVNDAPVVTAPADQTIPEDGATETLYFTVADIDSAVTSIVMSATSSDPALVAATGIVLAGNCAERTVAVQPMPNANGDVTITLTANDQNTLNNLGYATFLVHVTAVDDAPTIDAISPYTMYEDTVSEPIAVTVADIDDDPATLTLSAVSGNPSLIDAGGITFGRDEANGERWVQLTPKANQNGSALITLKATDASGKYSLRSFLLTVKPVNDPPEISLVEDQTIFEDEATGTITFTVGDIDNDVLELAVTGTSGDTDAVAPSGITITGNGAERTVKVTPLPNQNGDVAITLTVTDPLLLTDSKTFVVHITPVNDAPAFTAGNNQQALEDCGTQTVDAWATGLSLGMPNEAAQELVFHVSNDHQSLFTEDGQPSIAPDGTLTYTPVPDGYGVARVTVYGKDNGGTDHGGVDTSASKTFTITVLPVNDQPVFEAADEVTFNEDSGAHTVPYVTPGSIDPGPVENETQTYTFVIDHVVTDSVAGNTALFSAGPTVNASTGAISFTPSPNANGVARVMVALRDDDGTDNGGLNTSVLHTFTIRIAAVNDPPLFTLPASVTVNEDSGAYSKACATGISAGGGTDETQQSLAFTLSGYNAALFATAPSMNSQGVLSFTPATNAFGSTTVTVVLSDGALTVSHTFQITILALNDAPSFTTGADQATLEDAGAQTVSAWAGNLSIGPDNEKPQTLTFHTANDNPALFTTTGQPTIQSNGTLTYTPASDAFGTANVTVYVTDNGASTGANHNQSASVIFRITVAPVNDQPTFLPGEDQQTLEDSGAQSVSGWAAGMNAGAANEAEQTFAFAVNNNQPALFSAEGQPAISPDGTLRYTPADDAFGEAVVTVVLTDNGGTDNEGVNTANAVTFVIEVLPVNDRPSFADQGDITVMEDEGATSKPWVVPDSVFTGPDNESQTHTFVIEAVTPRTLAGNTALFAQGPTIDPLTGAIRFTPMENANGAVEVTVVLRDPDGVENGGLDTSVVHRLTITVLAVDDPPMFETHGEITVLEDSGAYADVYATGIQPGGGSDEADQTLAFTLENNHPEMFAQEPAMNSAGQLSFTPAPDVFGIVTIAAQLSDGRSILQKTFAITIVPVNDQPAFEHVGDITVQEDAGETRLPLVKADTLTLGPDNETQTATFRLLQTQVQTVAGNTALFSQQPTIAAEDGTLRFTPMTNANGTAVITFTLQDSGGVENGGVDTSATHTLTITVTPVDDPPTFTPGAGVTVNEDGGAYDAPFASAITPGGGTDEADQSVTFALGGYDTGLFATAPSISAKGRLSFQPAPDAYGNTTVTVGLNDGNNTTLATFPITLRPVNDPPTFTAGGDQQVLQNAPAQVIPGWASAISRGPANENAQTLTFQVSNNNKTLFTVNGQPAVSSAGQLTYTPNPGANGTAQVSVSLTDNGGTMLGGKSTSDTKTFTITVLPDSEQPFTTLTVTKVWSDNDNSEKLRPTSITVYVYNESGIVSSQKLSATNGWKYQFANLPAFSETGVPLHYQVLEAPVEQYSAHYSYSALAATVENTHIIDPFEKADTQSLLVVEEYNMPLGANNNLNEGDCFN